jgi:hypothetical protein
MLNDVHKLEHDMREDLVVGGIVDTDESPLTREEVILFMRWKLLIRNIDE